MFKILLYIYTYILYIHILYKYIYELYYYKKANEEIQKRKWIPETRKREQLPGGCKKYIFVFFSILVLVKFPGFFGFLEESILFKI